MTMENKFSILRAASLIARSLEVTIRGLPDIKNPPSPLINPFNPQESLSLKFFLAGLPLHVLREAEAGSPIKGGLCGAQYQHGDLYHAWKRKFGGMEVSEARRLLVVLTALALAAVVGIGGFTQTRRASRARPFRNCGRDRSKALPDQLEQPRRHSSSADESAGERRRRRQTVRHGLFDVSRRRRPHAHGYRAVDVPARRGSHRTLGARYSDRELFWIIKNGIRWSGMPAFGRVESDEHIWNLVHYVRTLRAAQAFPRRTEEPRACHPKIALDTAGPSATALVRRATTGGEAAAILPSLPPCSLTHRIVEPSFLRRTWPRLLSFLPPN